MHDAEIKRKQAVPGHTEPLVLNLKEYSARLNLDSRTLKKMMSKFNIPHIKLERRILFPVESADAAIKRIAEEHIAEAR